MPPGLEGGVTMTQLPYASTDVCPSCGSDAQRNRYRFSVVKSPARSTIHTGNLCEGCYEEVVEFIESGARDSADASG